MDGGFANVFVSHYQAEPITKTITATETFESFGWEHLCFPSYRMPRPISSLMITLLRNSSRNLVVPFMVADPWAEPDTIKRVWCAFKVLCTVEGQAPPHAGSVLRNTCQMALQLVMVNSTQ